MNARSSRNTGSRALLVTVFGLGCAGFCYLALVTWTQAHFGRFDPEYVGPTLWLPFVLAALALASGWATATTGRVGSLAAALAIALSAITAALILINIPGAFNGITPGGLPLIGALAVAVAVARLAVALVVRPSGNNRRPLSR